MALFTPLYDFTGSTGTSIATYSGGEFVRHASSPTGAQVLTNENRARQSTATASYYLNTTYTPPSPDYDVVMDIRPAATVGTTSRLTILGRFSTAAISGYGFAASTVDDTVYLARYDAGSGTIIATTSHTFTASTAETFKLRMVGNQISGYIDDVLVLGPITDATHTAAGYVGVRAHGSAGPSDVAGLHYDNFFAATLGSASAPTLLTASVTNITTTTATPRVTFTR